jgi:hypothetical protein
MPVALTCPRCGAPLPRPTSDVVECVYCSATSNVASDLQPSRLQMIVIKGFKDARANGATYFESLVAGARKGLGAMGETDAFARVVMAIASDFDGEHGTKISTDALALSKIVEAYLAALPALRADGQSQLDLPELDGKHDLKRWLTPEIVGQLADRAPV